MTKMKCTNVRWYDRDGERHDVANPAHVRVTESGALFIDVEHGTVVVEAPGDWHHVTLQWGAE